MTTNKMCQSHIEGFLNDVKRANPRFTENRSSLKNLLAYLRNTNTNPVPFNVQKAKHLCGNPNEPRLMKYDTALKNLTAVWSTPKPYPGLAVAVGRLMFRGDARPPNHIFSNGFSARQEGPMTYRNQKEDIDPKTAVAMSPSPYVAANFPLPGNWGPNAFNDATNSDCWVYACYIDTAYNTAGQQAFNAIAGSPGAQALLYASEMATPAIPANRILGAVPVDRTFNWVHIPKPADWISRGTFSFRKAQWTTNNGYTGPDKHVYIALLLTGANPMIGDSVRPFPS